MPFPTLEDLPEPGIEPISSVLAGGFHTTESPGHLPALRPTSCFLLQLPRNLFPLGEISLASPTLSFKFLKIRISFYRESQIIQSKGIEGAFSVRPPYGAENQNISDIKSDLVCEDLL